MKITGNAPCRSIVVCVYAFCISRAGYAQNAPDPGAYSSVLQKVDNTDQNGVDLGSGKLLWRKELLTIGQGRQPMSAIFSAENPVPVNGFPTTPLNLDGAAIPGSEVPGNPPDYGQSLIKLPGQNYPLRSYNGNSATFSGGSNHTHISFVGRDGVTAEFDYPGAAGCNLQNGCNPLSIPVQSITFQDGEVWMFANGRIRSSRGYGMQKSSDGKYHAFNETIVACDWGAAAACPDMANAPTFSMNYTFPNYVVVDPQNSTARVLGVSALATGQPTAITYDSNPERNINFTSITNPPGGYAYVTSITKAGATWTYNVQRPPFYDDYPCHCNYNGANYFVGSTTVQDPNQNSMSVVQIPELGVVTSKTDANGHTWTFRYYGEIPTGSTDPEGVATVATLDSRGNATDIATTPKSGSGLAVTHVTAGFPSSCTAFRTCNKPLWVKDANGNETDYTYDDNHGGVTSVTGPAVSGVRPQTRYSYAQRYAWVLNSGGAFVHASSPIWLLTSESSCRASSATGNPAAPCSGNDEVRIDYDYGPDAGPNNLFLRGKLVTADGVGRRTCYGNDQWGHKIWETKPRAGLASCY